MRPATAGSTGALQRTGSMSMAGFSISQALSPQKLINREHRAFLRRRWRVAIACVSATLRLGFLMRTLPRLSIVEKRLIEAKMVDAGFIADVESISAFINNFGQGISEEELVNEYLPHVRYTPGEQFSVFQMTRLMVFLKRRHIAQSTTEAMDAFSALQPDAKSQQLSAGRVEETVMSFGLKPEAAHVVHSGDGLQYSEFARLVGDHHHAGGHHRRLKSTVGTLPWTVETEGKRSESLEKRLSSAFSVRQAPMTIFSALSSGTQRAPRSAKKNRKTTETPQQGSTPALSVTPTNASAASRSFFKPSSPMSSQDLMEGSMSLSLTGFPSGVGISPSRTYESETAQICANLKAAAATIEAPKIPQALQIHPRDASVHGEAMREVFPPKPRKGTTKGSWSTAEVAARADEMKDNKKADRWRRSASRNVQYTSTLRPPLAGKARPCDIERIERRSAASRGRLSTTESKSPTRAFRVPENRRKGYGMDEEVLERIPRPDTAPLTSDKRYPGLARQRGELMDKISYQKQSVFSPQLAPSGVLPHDVKRNIIMTRIQSAGAERKETRSPASLQAFAAAALGGMDAPPPPIGRLKTRW